jgi:Cytochrome c oxidase subunit IV
MTQPSNPPRSAEATSDFHLPSPSIWPFALGAGVSMVAFGVLVSPLFCLVGAALFVLALAGWVQELRRE